MLVQLSPFPPTFQPSLIHNNKLGAIVKEKKTICHAQMWLQSGPVSLNQHGLLYHLNIQNNILDIKTSKGGTIKTY